MMLILHTTTNYSAPELWHLFDEGTHMWPAIYNVSFNNLSTPTRCDCRACAKSLRLSRARQVAATVARAPSRCDCRARNLWWLSRARQVAATVVRATCGDCRARAKSLRLSCAQLVVTVTRAPNRCDCRARAKSLRLLSRVRQIAATVARAKCYSVRLQSTMIDSRMAECNTVDSQLEWLLLRVRPRHSTARQQTQLPADWTPT